MYLKNTVLYKTIFTYSVKMLLEKIRNVSWCGELHEMYSNKRLGQHVQVETSWILARKKEATSELWG